jgi:hypothetical protein
MGHDHQIHLMDMSTATYVDSSKLYAAVVSVPKTHELPRMIVLAKKNVNDEGTTQQYFYREDVV